MTSKQLVTELAGMVKNGQATLLRTYGGTEALAAKLGCTDLKNGLNPNLLEEQKKKFGVNELEPPFVPNYFGLVWEGLKDMTMVILSIAAVVSLILGIAFEEDKSTSWIEGAAILVAVFSVTNFQAWTDYNNALTFRRQYLDLENNKRVHVIRQGDLLTIHPKELVVGDILRVEAGLILPADGVLVLGNAIRMDESALTGESKALEKQPFDTNGWKQGDAMPFLLSGTSVMNGQGRMLVVAVGENSLQGQILAQIAGTVKKGSAEEEENVRTSVRRASVRSHAKTIGQLGTLDENKVTGLSSEKAVEVADGGASATVGIGEFDPAIFGSSTSLNPRASQFSLRSHRVGDTNTLLNSRMIETRRAHKKFDRICCRSRKSAKPVEVDIEAGTLSDKLDAVVIVVGKVGVFVAIVVFIVMVTRWSVFNFGGSNGICPEYDNLPFECGITPGCIISPQNTTCSRIWIGGEDFATILRFFITSITILVVVIPEGLPLAVTISLSMGMRRMAKLSNQVKNMDSTETMGSATTICTDKTGTLTENRMAVVRLWFTTDNEFDKQKIGAETLGSAIKAFANEDLKQKLVDTFALATSPLSEVNGEQQKGNATDCAQLRILQQMGLPAQQVREKNPPPAGSALDWGEHVIPFSSSRKRSTIVVKTGSGYRVYSVGAPQYFMETCTSYVSSSGAVLDLAPYKGKVNEVLGDYAHSALRTLALAYRDYPTIPAAGWGKPARAEEGEDALLFEIETNLTLFCVLGIEDALRDSIKTAVQNCYTSGVDVRMCTGDSLETATAIALQAGILRQIDLTTNAEGRQVPKECFAMTGAEFQERIFEHDKNAPMVFRRAYDFKAKSWGEFKAPAFKIDKDGERVYNMKRFDEVWPKLRVLARCLPEDKLYLVKGLRKSELFKDKAKCDALERDFGIKVFPDHQVVAVTGDGTNDAPALKAANVGFAMGIVGTDIAKQACDIILMDDNFASVIVAILWGRNVFDSISKFVQFQLTVNFTAIIMACIGAFAYERSCLQAVQMLWVNLIMDSFASFALATDSPGPELLERPPYGKKRPVISPIMFANIVGQGILQVSVLIAILFDHTWLPDANWVVGNVEKYPPAIHVAGEKDRGISVHWTIIFNTFVMFQLCNQIICRKCSTVERLKTTFAEWNYLDRFFSNPLFLVILLIEFGGQVIIVTFAGPAFTVEQLSISQWIFCIGLGCLSFPVQWIINCLIILHDKVFGEKKIPEYGGHKLEDDEGQVVVKVEPSDV